MSASAESAIAAVRAGDLDAVRHFEVTRRSFFPDATWDFYEDERTAGLSAKDHTIKIACIVRGASGEFAEKLEMTFRCFLFLLRFELGRRWHTILGYRTLLGRAHQILFARGFRRWSDLELADYLAIEEALGGGSIRLRFTIRFLQTLAVENPLIDAVTFSIPESPRKIRCRGPVLTEPVTDEIKAKLFGAALCFLRNFGLPIIAAASYYSLLSGGGVRRKGYIRIASVFANAIRRGAFAGVDPRPPTEIRVRFRGIPDLNRMVQGACFIVIANTIIARTSEILDLRRGCIRLCRIAGRWTFMIVRVQEKTGEWPRPLRPVVAQPATAFAIDLLEKQASYHEWRTDDRLDPPEFLFPPLHPVRVSASETVTGNDMGIAIRQFAARFAGVPPEGITPQALRTAMVGDVVKEVDGLVVAADQAGHKYPGITARYGTAGKFSERVADEIGSIGEAIRDEFFQSHGKEAGTRRTSEVDEADPRSAAKRGKTRRPS